MKTIGVLVFLLLLFHESWGCTCGGPRPLTGQILQHYPYVAHVRVLTIEKFVVPGDNPKDNQKAKFTVEVIENLKKPLPAELILDFYNTSCDPGFRVGQEWVIFAKDYKGYPIVYPSCDYSRPYKDLSQLRLRSGDELLNTVRLLTGQPIKPQNGRLEEFYPTGVRAYLTLYRQGGREEERTVWHANGRVWGKEFYKNGLKEGPARWWNPNGTPLSAETFAAGIAIDTSRRWYNTDTDTTWLRTTHSLTEHARDSLTQFYKQSHLQSVTIADRRGKILRSQQYDWKGRLRDEVVGVPDAGIECRTAFDERGGVSSVMVFRLVEGDVEKKHKLVYRLDYEADGSRTAAYYDAKGRLTRWTRVKDGVETVLEEKRYPD